MKLPNPCNLPAEISRGELLWSHDGSRIYFTHSAHRRALLRTSKHGYLFGACGGWNSEKLTTIPMGIGDLVISPDGGRLAFHGAVSQPVRSYSQADLWVMDVKPEAKPQNLTADYDFDMGSSVFGDNAAPRGGQRTWHLLVARWPHAVRYRGEARTHAHRARGRANRHGDRNYPRATRPCSLFRSAPRRGILSRSSPRP